MLDYWLSPGGKIHLAHDRPSHTSCCSPITSRWRNLGDFWTYSIAKSTQLLEMYGQFEGRDAELAEMAVQYELELLDKIEVFLKHDICKHCNEYREMLISHYTAPERFRSEAEKLEKAQAE